MQRFLVLLLNVHIQLALCLDLTIAGLVGPLSCFKLVNDTVKSRNLHNSTLMFWQHFLSLHDYKYPFGRLNKILLSQEQYCLYCLSIIECDHNH